jgi:peptidoglycan/LPS O-acetylase OafA/YrhL
MVLAPDATGGEVAAPPPRKLPHYPGLDGVCGLAALGVLFFHGGFEWARGGYLGVSPLLHAVGLF